MYFPMKLLRLATTLVLALLVGRGAAASAAEPQDLARTAFAAGERAFAQRRFRDAAVKFEEAYTLTPHPSIQFNLARSLEAAGDVGPALKAYRIYLHFSSQAGDRVAVTAAISGLERKLGQRGVQSLVLFIEPAEGQATIDGTAVTGTPVVAELPFGQHEVVVVARGYREHRVTVELTAQRSAEVAVTLEAMPLATDVPVAKAPFVLEPPPPPPPLLSATPEPVTKPRVFTWVAAGVTVAAAGTATGLFVAANGAGRELRAMERSRAEQDAIVSRGKGLQTGSDVALGIAVAAAITTVVLVFVEGR